MAVRQHRRCCSSPASRSACTMPVGRLAGDDGPDPDRPRCRSSRSASCSATCCTVDSMGPALGGGVVAVRPPRRHPGSRSPAAAFCSRSASCMPSYWLVQAGTVGVGGATLAAKGWLVIAAWTVAMVACRRLGLPARHQTRLTEPIGYRHGDASRGTSAGVRAATLDVGCAADCGRGGWRRYVFPGLWLIYLGQTGQRRRTSTRTAPAAVAGYADRRRVRGLSTCSRCRAAGPDTGAGSGRCTSPACALTAAECSSPTRTPSSSASTSPC